MSAMTEPNRVRDEAVPNIYRTGVVADRRQPAEQMASPARTGGVPMRLMSARKVFVGGIMIAMLGVPLFFGGEFRGEMIGVGLISLGAGITITVVARRLIADSVAAARRSKAAAVGVLVLAPHTIVIGVVGLGLIAFGLAVLGIAFGMF